jgi:hypothetical protein
VPSLPCTAGAVDTINVTSQATGRLVETIAAVRVISSSLGGCAALRSEAAMPEAWLELDTALKERIRIVLDDPQRLVTEAQLRKLSEEGRAYRLILGAELGRLERRLAELDADPGSPLGAIAPAFRRVHDFRAHLAELNRLLSALDDRARQVRTSWLLRSPRGR